MPPILHKSLLSAFLLFSTVVSAIEITEGSHESRPQFVIRTESATYYFDRAGGGFSRVIDRDGRDWINFSRKPLKEFPASAAAGYRGMPNAVFGGGNPDAGAGHPGFDQCESTVEGEVIHTKSKSGKWAWTWTFTETTATMEMVEADPEHTWWFLYEGPIAGSFNPKKKFWGTSNGGPRTDIPDNKNQFFDRFKWVYFGDVETPRVLFIGQHEEDDLDDTVWYLGSSDGGAATASDGMMVFGFGRGEGTKTLFQGAGQKFTVSFLEVGLPLSGARAPSAELHESISKELKSILDGKAPTASIDRAIRLCHGTEQSFGELGEPQRWVNVLGNVSQSGAVTSLEYTLNGSEKSTPLATGSDLHRLALPGDFNVELAWDELERGKNTLEILARYSDGQTIQTNVTLNIERGNQWPLPYHVDFSKVPNLQNVVQVVDGEWHLTADGVRTTQPWYDRVLSMGDTTWTNYEATVRLTLHGYTPPQRGAPTYGVTHMGVAFRWRGHTADGRQPSRQWYPLGAQGEYLLKSNLAQNRFRILHNGGAGWRPAYGKNDLPVELEKPFFIKAHVDTMTNGDTVYRFKQWNEGEQEPAEWAVESSEPSDKDLPSGALCLVPHNSDVTIHSIKVVPLRPRTN